MSEDGHLVADRYRLVRRIGSGAMGVVWLAVDERLNREVAVKKLLLAPGLPPDEAEEAVARCMREGRIAARLHHPNAIAVFDVVDEDSVPCLVMEYLPSESLAGAMGDRGELDPVEVAGIGAQVAAALAAAHVAGIVHRDIKPGNILLGDDGSVKLTDFGISRASDDVTVTKTGLIAGTPAYLAPEVAIGRDPGPESDVFSLGSTLYAAVEGEPPFGLSENTLGLLHAVASGTITPPQRSGPLTGVLTALLATDIADRPTAAQARDMLTAVAEGREPELPVLLAAPTGQDAPTRMVAAAATTLTPKIIPSRPPIPARSRKPLVFAGVGVAAILGLGGWLLLGRGQAVNQVDNQPPVISPYESIAPSAPSSTKNPQPPVTVRTPRSTTPTPSSVSVPSSVSSAPEKPSSPAPSSEPPEPTTTTPAPPTTTTTAPSIKPSTGQTK